MLCYAIQASSSELAGWPGVTRFESRLLIKRVGDAIRRCSLVLCPTRRRLSATIEGVEPYRILPQATARIIDHRGVSFQDISFRLPRLTHPVTQLTLLAVALHLRHSSHSYLDHATPFFVSLNSSLPHPPKHTHCATYVLSPRTASVTKQTPGRYANDNNTNIIPNIQAPPRPCPLSRPSPPPTSAALLKTTSAPPPTSTNGP